MDCVWMSDPDGFTDVLCGEITHVISMTILTISEKEFSKFKEGI